MHEDEAATVQDLKAHQRVILPLIGRHGGRIIDTAGDGIMAEFPSVIGATACAVEIQTVMAERNEGVPESRRCGFASGSTWRCDPRRDPDLRDGINIAARWSPAEPGVLLPIPSTIRSAISCRLPSREGGRSRHRAACAYINSTCREHPPSVWPRSSGAPP
jgi:class 3 adenylate cyclase